MAGIPFGSSDDVVAAILAAALSECKQKNIQSFEVKTQPTVDPAALIKKSAEYAKQLYDAYINVGFTEGQAFALTRDILTSKKKQKG